ncbi:MAG: hypothetical protein A3D74_03845 [Candidatus Levybacteria bacterium RIFCSPHIGHO2_02_FULL_37_13]|nr:MAG: hypothetical protein A3D74_03845 [Candidatus Levybacteria bacterium RIFCSPHIGHO2_02_FULL_37_13]OGH30441.1 MAG: hypothetical protein A3E40_05370 [Candidatus Levybacteria bacterium RIFCSPHIGHO2_12_FULL_37_9]
MVEKAETPSSAPDFVTSPELEEEIVKGRTTTFTITREFLTYYEQAAINLEKTSKIKFEVKVIAGPDEHYVTEYIKPVHPRLRANGQNPTITAVKSKLAVKPGSVAIALKKPEGVTNDMAFNAERQKIQPINPL